MHHMPQFLRPFLITLLFCFYIQKTFAQHWQWVKSSDGAVFVTGSGIAIDDKGNSFVTGYFTETVNLGGTTLTSSGSEDIFLAKFDTTGNVVWAKSAGGSGRDLAHSIVLDTHHNIFITGRINASGPFKERSDIFTSKYDPDGNLIWTQNAGGKGTDIGSDIVVDAVGNSYVTGRFGVSATFDGITVTGSSDFNTFLAKYDIDGKIIWVKSAGGTYEVFQNSVGHDKAGNIYLAGSFKNTTTIGNITLIADGYDDIFLAKYDPNGNVIWAKRAGGYKFDFAYNLAVDSAGNCYIIGDFSSPTANFDAITITNEEKSGYFYDVFIVKYDPTGEVDWAKQAGGASFDNANDIAIDEEGNSYVIGNFEGISVFGTTTLYSEKNYDIFIVKFNPAGEVIWAKQAGGPPDDSGNGIAVDANGNGYVTGLYNRTASFDNFKLTGKEGNMFIAKFGPIPLSDIPIEEKPSPDTSNVEVVLIPNIITPNGDNLNDTFSPRIPRDIVVDLKIYDRWGKLIYEQVNYKNTWNGDNLAPGTYYYLLTTTSDISWKGWVEIIK